MRSRRLLGYTLLELAVALSVLGLISLLLWRFGNVAIQRIVEVRAPQALEVADDALVGFVMANHRLPCPDTTGSGVENCSGGSVGRLPFVTLRLARTDLENVRYGVYRNGATVDLAQAVDRFKPLVTVTSVTPGITNIIGQNPGGSYNQASSGASEATLGNVNGIDFCDALRAAGTAPFNAGALKVMSDDDSTPVKNVAYTLALPGLKDMNGDGNPFDGANSGTLTSSSPTRPASVNYDDFVLTSDFRQLFNRLSCGGIVSAAGHGQFNAQTATALLYGDFVNYYTQLEITVDLAYANKLMADAALEQALGDVSNAAASIIFAVAKAMVTAGATTPIVVQAAVDVTVAAAGLAMAIASEVSAVQALDGAKETRDAFQPFVDEANALAAAVLADSLYADSIGIYGPLP